MVGAKKSTFVEWLAARVKRDVSWKKIEGFNFHVFLKLIYEKVADAEQLATCSLDSPQCVLPQKKKSHYKRSQ